MAQWYVDNNETIYATHSVVDNSVAVNDSNTCTLGLADLTTLSGQSTWLINRIHMFVKLQGPELDPPNDLHHNYKAIAGIAPAGFISGGGTLNSPDDYQEIKGWPLKGAFKFMQVYLDANGSRTNSPAATSTWSKTWTPSRGNHLALNRSQEIVLNCVSETSGGTTIMICGLYVEARRGQ